jgi:hypothetical protein
MPWFLLRLIVDLNCIVNLNIIWEAKVKIKSNSLRLDLSFVRLKWRSTRKDLSSLTGVPIWELLAQVLWLVSSLSGVHFEFVAWKEILAMLAPVLPSLHVFYTTLMLGFLFFYSFIHMCILGFLILLNAFLWSLFA